MQPATSSQSAALSCPVPILTLRCNTRCRLHAPDITTVNRRHLLHGIRAHGSESDTRFHRDGISPHRNRSRGGGRFRSRPPNTSENTAPNRTGKRPPAWEVKFKERFKVTVLTSVAIAAGRAVLIATGGLNAIQVRKRWMRAQNDWAQPPAAAARSGGGNHL